MSISPLDDQHTIIAGVVDPRCSLLSLLEGELFGWRGTTYYCVPPRCPLLDARHHVGTTNMAELILQIRV